MKQYTKAECDTLANMVKSQPTTERQTMNEETKSYVIDVIGNDIFRKQLWVEAKSDGEALTLARKQCEPLTIEQLSLFINLPETVKARKIDGEAVDGIFSGDTKPVVVPTDKSPAVKKVRREKPKSRSQRWSEAAAAASDALANLKDIQQEFQDWLDNLPENLQSSNLGEKLQTVCDIDIEGAQSTIEEAEGADLPLGFGRD